MTEWVWESQLDIFSDSDHCSILVPKKTKADFSSTLPLGCVPLSWWQSAIVLCLQNTASFQSTCVYDAREFNAFHFVCCAPLELTVALPSHHCEAGRALKAIGGEFIHIFLLQVTHLNLPGDLKKDRKLAGYLPLVGKCTHDHRADSPARFGMWHSTLKLLQKSPPPHGGSFLGRKPD